MLVSQNRELLADATAVELSRDPAALSRIIYKAWLANSYLGDTTMLTPLFWSRPIQKKLLIAAGAGCSILIHL